MRIAQINVTCGAGSTGKICVGISRLLSDKGIDNKIFYSSGNSGFPGSEKYMNKAYSKIQALKSRALGNYGFNSGAATKRLILMLNGFNPDIVILHNLHGHNCNLDKLLSYFKREGKRIIWVFHDCWAFTGYCTHYDGMGCDKWRDECKNCPQRGLYSWFFDRSNELFNKKRTLVSGLDLTVVTPSRWLKSQAEQSFLKGIPVVNIPNGIDLSVFRPRESDFRKKHNLSDAFIVLGVAYGWGDKKGLDVFIRLAGDLPKDYRVVLVGTNQETEAILPENVISISRTGNQQELAEIYTAADVLVNASREETYPTVNMEAIACGTPVITFDTGGSSEMLTEKTGESVKKNDYDSLYNAVISAKETSKYNRGDLLDHAKSFAESLTYQKYLDLVTDTEGK